MAGEFDVEQTQMRTAAGVAREAGAMMSGVDLAGAAQRAGVVMPGSESAAAATALAASWARGVEGWAHAATSYGNNLIGAADNYEQADSSAASSIGDIIIPGLDGPG